MRTRCRQIADAAGISKSNLWRVLRRQQQEEGIDPARHRDFAPHLAVEQPRTGLTIGIGTAETEPPVATITFGESHRVLLLLDAGWSDDASIRDVWPVIAASVTASNARVQVYGPLPRRDWDSPTYFGECDDTDLERLCIRFETRIGRIDKGDDVPPMLVCVPLSYRGAGNKVVDTALSFGHHARIYVIARTRYWYPQMASVSSVLAVGGAQSGSTLPTKLPGVPRIPSQPDTAILSTPESIAEFVLPPNSL